MVVAAASGALGLMGLSWMLPATPRFEMPLQHGWKFEKVDVLHPRCETKVIKDVSGRSCQGFVHQAQVTDAVWCRTSCCGDDQCDSIQWCPGGNSSCGSWPNCRTGLSSRCAPEAGSFLQKTRREEDTEAITSHFHEFAFGDDDWQGVDLPHDMLIDNDFSPKADKVHGFLPYRKGWYRLRFTMPAEAQNMKVLIEFGGVMGQSVVYLNEQEVDTRKGGYATFHVDVSNQAKPGEVNLLAVGVDATMPDSWWYDGGGLYRNVRVLYLPRVHIVPWGVYLPAKVDGRPNAEGTRADAQLLAHVEVANEYPYDRAVRVRVGIESPAGEQIALVTTPVRRIASHGTVTIPVTIDLPNATLWSPETPRLYHCHTKILHRKYHEELDAVSQTFGVRKLQWSPDQGFQLNGKPMKIRGFANHQDFAGVGVAVPDSLQKFRVAKLKDMGANAWRTAHNPPNTAVLTACDQQGMLVMDEHHRLRASDPWVLRELADMIRRDRNHPSIFIWSMCNEALCEGFNATSARIMREVIQELDPHGQRVISAAMNYDFRDDDFVNTLDVIGINYNIGMYDRTHKRYPNKPILSSESSSELSDRSVYTTDATLSRVSAYDVNVPNWGNTAEESWCTISDKDYVAGSFYWTGFDYKGEPTPYEWPNVNSHFGVIDIAGFAKDNFYYHQSVFFDAVQRPVLHVLPHWNWDQAAYCTGVCNRRQDLSKIVKVWAYTNGDEVELFLNNVSLGRRETTPCQHVEWEVLYSPGVLRAESYRRGDATPFITKTVVTSGPAARVKLSLDWPLSPVHAHRRDTALVRVEVVDASGQLVPTASALLDFDVAGPANLIGLGNGDPSSHEHDKPNSTSHGRRKAWNGLARAILQTVEESGMITLTVTGMGLTGDTLHIDAKP